MSAPFQIGDRVRIVVDIFNEPYAFGSEWTITANPPTEYPGEMDGWISVDGCDPFLVPSDLELVERAS